MISKLLLCKINLLLSCKTCKVVFFFKSSPGDVYTDFREKGKEGERETSISCLSPLIHAPTRDWTHNLLVYGTTFQSTEPPCQGKTCSVLITKLAVEIFYILHKSTGQKKIKLIVVWPYIVCCVKMSSDELQSPWSHRLRRVTPPETYFFWTSNNESNMPHVGLFWGLW